MNIALAIMLGLATGGLIGWYVMMGSIYLSEFEGKIKNNAKN